MTYRLAAADVDGTILARGKAISPRVRGAVAGARRFGCEVTLASGRMYPLLADLVDLLGIQVPVICYGGALIVDPRDCQVLYQRTIPLDLAREVIKAARVRGHVARVYLGDDVVVDRIDPLAYNYDSLIRVKARAVGNLLEFLDVEPTHLAIDAPPDRTRALVTEMRDCFQGRLNVTTGHPLLTEFSLPDVHKGTALSWLAQHLGIPRSETLAIGDDWNDLPLLRAAGLGLAVANAQPELVAMADGIVPSVDDDGVAVALETHVFRGAMGEGD